MSLAVNAPAARMRGGGIATMSTPDCRDAVLHYLKIARASMTLPIVDGYRQSKESTTHALTLASFRLRSYSLQHALEPRGADSVKKSRAVARENAGTVDASKRRLQSAPCERNRALLARCCSGPSQFESGTPT
jgi:hypothetical protein